MTLSIILPVYNDIDELIHGLNYLKENFPRPYELIIVDDGSKFSNQYLKLASQFNAKYLQNIQNEGKGASVRKGALAARGDMVMFTDSDVPYHAQEMIAMVELMNDHSIDIVCGSRFGKNIYMKKTSMLRGRLSKLFNFLTNIFLNLRGIDSQCGLKVFRSSIVEELFKEQKIKRYSFDAEILVRAVKRNYKLVSLPVTLREITPGSLKLYKDGIRMLWDLFVIFVYYRIIKDYKGSSNHES
ncbi:MAG: hypothetical protein CME62_03185 [Halobacteriovoraceae bacterium]|nr:hypothetical protein [Halobacteriovoraceae bacterium]|tara:strand:- start:9932 stop:10657 length:726 start_codon:yes stop_codon:yes gene_type:complete